MKSMRVDGTITLLSPLSHNERTDGTYTTFRRLTIFLGGQEHRVPVLSGNSIRGQIRRVLMADLIRQAGVTVQEIGDDAYYTLFVGGRLKKQERAKTGGLKPGAVRDVLPALSLLGSVVAQRIMPGKLICGMAVPIARETEEMTGIPSEISVYSLTEEVPYSRRDDLEEKQDASPDKAQMQYHVECMKTGTRLAHFFALASATPEETGAFWRGLRLLAESCHLGGLRSKGHGRFSWTYPPGDESAYQAHLELHRDRVRETIRALGA